MTRLPTTLALAALALAACTASSDDVRPPADQFFFPTGMIAAPDESRVFVINANSDLRYDSGTVVALDVPAIAMAVQDWDNGQVADGCSPDESNPITMLCDETPFLDAAASVRIGNFATDGGLQQLDDGSYRLFVAVRGDPSLTWIDLATIDGVLSCGNPDATFPECDDDHRLARLRDDPDIAEIPSEPFSLFVDGENGYVVITHLADGAVSVASAPRDGTTPQLSDALGGLFARNPNTGIGGVVDAAGRTPGQAGDLIYLTSRGEARIQVLHIDNPLGFPTAVAGDFFFLSASGRSTDSRGIAFGQGGDRAYIINRDPPLLQILDTSMSEFGRPENDFLAGVEICRQAANVTVSDLGRGERLYITCFRDGQLWTVDPVSAFVEAIADVGRGPHDVVALAGEQLLLVSNFREDTIAVVDLRPGSETENRVIMRVGNARTAEGSQ